MRVVRYDPFRMLRQFPWNDATLPSFFDDSGDLDNLLKVDVYLSEDKKNVIVEADLPGVSSDNVDIEVTSDSATIKASREEIVEEKNREYTHKERRFGAYARTISFPVQVNADGADASFKDGALKITVPVKEAVESKSVKVKVS